MLTSSSNVWSSRDIENSVGTAAQIEGPLYKRFRSAESSRSCHTKRHSATAFSIRPALPFPNNRGAGSREIALLLGLAWEHALQVAGASRLIVAPVENLVQHRLVGLLDAAVAHRNV